ncbi:MAG: hypothetical protein IIA23_10555 [Chloroflexi bacterium]|nr:hypothetical protein [Chloroflexota bacterium]
MEREAWNDEGAPVFLGRAGNLKKMLLKNSSRFEVGTVLQPVLAGEGHMHKPSSEEAGLAQLRDGVGRAVDGQVGAGELKAERRGARVEAYRPLEVCDGLIEL